MRNSFKSSERSGGGLTPLKGQEWPEKSKEPGTKRCSVPRAAMSKRGMMRGLLSVRLAPWWTEMSSVPSVGNWDLGRQDWLSRLSLYFES